MGNDGKQNGKWRFTSPTHVVHAFYQALLELEKEGGVRALLQSILQQSKTTSE